MLTFVDGGSLTSRHLAIVIWPCNLNVGKKGAFLWHWSRTPTFRTHKQYYQHQISFSSPGWGTQIELPKLQVDDKLRSAFVVLVILGVSLDVSSASGSTSAKNTLPAIAKNLDLLNTFPFNDGLLIMEHQQITWKTNPRKRPSIDTWRKFPVCALETGRSDTTRSWSSELPGRATDGRIWTKSSDIVHVIPRWWNDLKHDILSLV